MFPWSLPELLCALLGTVEDGVLTVGSVSAPVYNPDIKIKVPDVLFFNNPQVTHQTLDFILKQIFPSAVIIDSSSLLIQLLKFK